jgi:hypothetical protein
MVVALEVVAVVVVVVVLYLETSFPTTAMVETRKPFVSPVAVQQVEQRMALMQTFPTKFINMLQLRCQYHPFGIN